MPYPGLLHLECLPLQQATAEPYLHRRHSATVLAQSLWFGHAFCALYRLSSSGDQVLAEHTVPGGLCVLITSPVPDTMFSGHTARALSQVCHMSPLESLSRASTLLADVNHPGSQEDVVSSWEPAHSLLWGRDCSSPLPSGSGCQKPASLPPGREGPVCS